MSRPRREWLLPLAATVTLVALAASGLAFPAVGSETPEQALQTWRSAIASGLETLIPKTSVDPCASAKTTVCCREPGRAELEGVCRLQIAACEGICAQRFLQMRTFTSGVKAVLTPQLHPGVVTNGSGRALDWKRLGDQWVAQASLGPQAAELELWCKQCEVTFLTEEEP